MSQTDSNVEVEKEAPVNGTEPSNGITDTPKPTQDVAATESSIDNEATETKPENTKPEDKKDTSEASAKNELTAAEKKAQKDAENLMVLNAKSIYEFSAKDIDGNEVSRSICLHKSQANPLFYRYQWTSIRVIPL